MAGNSTAVGCFPLNCGLVVSSCRFVGDSTVSSSLPSLRFVDVVGKASWGAADAEDEDEELEVATIVVVEGSTKMTEEGDEIIGTVDVEDEEDDEESGTGAAEGNTD